MKPKGADMEAKSILFVDDDLLYLKLLKSCLRGQDIAAHFAPCAEGALEILRKNRCEIMFTDLNMPGMNGYLLSKLAKILLPDLVITLVTGEISPDVSRLAAQAGISRVIEKPAQLEQIREIINSSTPTFCGTTAAASAPFR
jgi:DNA-binding NtrC family response regulator